MKRTLTLRRETLTLLTNDEMAGLAGASVPTVAAIASLDPFTTCIAVRESLLDACSGYGCHTYDSDCSCRI